VVRLNCHPFGAHPVEAHGRQVDVKEPDNGGSVPGHLVLTEGTPPKVAVPPRPAARLAPRPWSSSAGLPDRGEPPRRWPGCVRKPLALLPVRNPALVHS